MSKVKLKVCGLRDNAKEVIDEINPHLAGFIYYKKSPRYVGDLDVSKINAICKVGVFVNESLERVKELVNKDGLHIVQLHGDESADYCKALHSHVGIIKVFSGNEQIDQDLLENYAEDIDYYLFDTRDENFGGTGRSFDWKKLKDIELSKPVILSGGIGLEEAQQALKMENLKVYAIDVNSKFEIEPGLKNLEMLKNLKEQMQ
ncbi:MAG: phosphoribosylanthranilate isomerase [Fulvivirga sp.]